MRDVGHHYLSRQAAVRCLGGDDESNDGVAGVVVLLVIPRRLSPEGTSLFITLYTQVLAARCMCVCVCAKCLLGSEPLLLHVT